MLSLRFLTMSAGDLWDLPKGKGMAQSYHEQPGSGLSTWVMKCKTGSEPVKMEGCLEEKVRECKMQKGTERQKCMLHCTNKMFDD